jgi:dipeptidase D
VENFRVEPLVKAIHAGLECGLFLRKYPYLDMISFGPTIKGAHSPDEKLEIESVNKFWKLLISVLTEIPEAE